MDLKNNLDACCGNGFWFDLHMHNRSKFWKNNYPLFIYLFLPDPVVPLYLFYSVQKNPVVSVHIDHSNFECPRDWTAIVRIPARLPVFVPLLYTHL